MNEVLKPSPTLCLSGFTTSFGRNVIIQANTMLGHIATVDILQIESIWTEELNLDEPSDMDTTNYFAMGVSGTQYHLSRITYEKLLANWKANGSL